MDSDPEPAALPKAGSGALRNPADASDLAPAIVSAAGDKALRAPDAASGRFSRNSHRSNRANDGGSLSKTPASPAVMDERRLMAAARTHPAYGLATTLEACFSRVETRQGRD